MNKKIKNKKFSIGNLFPKNQRGTDKILSIYWFVVLTIIAGGVFAMVYVFYGAPYDVRGIESGILAERVADCVARGGTIDSSFFSGKDFNKKINETFQKQCNINFNVENGYTDESEIQYFYKIEFYNLKDLTNPIFSFYNGNSNWETDCFVKKDNSKDYTRLAKCTEKRFYALSSGGDQYLIKILSVVGKSEKNVKQ
jgi:hypothetical protein